MSVKDLFKCICGKEYIISDLTGTTNYHGKVYYLKDGNTLIQHQHMGLLCPDCWKDLNKIESKSVMRRKKTMEEK